jgi:hypothetical protein
MDLLDRTLITEALTMSFANSKGPARGPVVYAVRVTYYDRFTMQLSIKVWHACWRQWAVKLRLLRFQVWLLPGDGSGPCLWTQGAQDQSVQQYL